MSSRERSKATTHVGEKEDFSNWVTVAQALRWWRRRSLRGELEPIPQRTLYSRLWDGHIPGAKKVDGTWAIPVCSLDELYHRTEAGDEKKDRTVDNGPNLHLTVKHTATVSERGLRDEVIELNQIVAALAKQVIALTQREGSRAWRAHE